MTSPVAVVGCGPSLAGVDLTPLRGHCHVIAVKAQIFDLPWADCGIGIDFPRLQEWLPRIAELTLPIYWGVDPFAWANSKLTAPANLTILRRRNGPELPRDDESLSGPTSGFAALGFAARKGPKQIYLFGFDYCAAPHVNSVHYATPRNSSEKTWQGWADCYARIAPDLTARGVSVVNASPNSRISAFPKITPAQAIEIVTASAAIPSSLLSVHNHPRSAASCAARPDR